MQLQTFRLHTMAANWILICAGTAPRLTICNTRVEMFSSSWLQANSPSRQTVGMVTTGGTAVDKHFLPLCLIEWKQPHNVPQRTAIMMWRNTQQIRHIESMLAQRWVSGADGGPTLIQHWFNVSQLYLCKEWCDETLDSPIDTRSWINVDPVS